MELFNLFQAWSYPLAYLVLAMLCHVWLRSKGGHILAAGFVLLFLVSMIWRVVDLADVGFGAYSTINVITFLFQLIAYGGIGFGIYQLATTPPEPLKPLPSRTDLEAHLSLPQEEVLDITPLQYQGERVMVKVLGAFSVLLGLLILALVVAEPALLFPFALLVGSFVLLTYVTARIARGRVLGNALKVGPEQLPEIHAIKERLMRRLDLQAPTEVYIIEEGPINAILVKFIGTRYVVLFSGLVNAMMKEGQYKELEFVLARALGHIKAKHFRFWLIQLLIAMEKINPIFYLLYERMCHYTSDRIGFVACGDYGASVTALVKLTVGDKLRAQVNDAALLQQYAEVSGSIGAFLAELFSGHPHLVKRIYRLGEYAMTLQAPAMRAGAAPPLVSKTPAAALSGPPTEAAR